jgi:hypothetical protein
MRHFDYMQFTLWVCFFAFLSLGVYFAVLAWSGQ